MSKRLLLTLLLLMILLTSACGPSASVPPTLDPNAQATSVQQTVVARQTEAVLANPPTLTPTLAPPTLTFTPVFTPTETLTPTLSTPQISVSVDTNCRTGPGKTFPNVGSLLVGETTQVIAGEPKQEYWYVVNPDNPAGYCWLWGEYATLTGNVFTLPIYTPPPPPTTSYTVTYKNIQTCNTFWINFELENESDATFKSISMVIEDSTTNPKTTVASQTNGFIDNEACSGPVKTDVLGPNAKVIVSSPAFSYNPAGHNMTGKVTLCTDLNMTGTCITKENSFKP